MIGGVLDKKRDKWDTLVTFDSDYLMGFSFDENQKDKKVLNISAPPLKEGERPLYIKTLRVNIDLCKHWKKESNELKETAYGREYSSLYPTPYKLFMSLQKLKKKKLVATEASEQEDICIYIDREYSGHFGRFKNKSNKIRYKASEINAVRVKLEENKRLKLNEH